MLTRSVSDIPAKSHWKTPRSGAVCMNGVKLCPDALPGSTKMTRTLGSERRAFRSTGRKHSIGRGKLRMSVGIGLMEYTNYMSNI